MEHRDEFAQPLPVERVPTSPRTALRVRLAARWPLASLLASTRRLLDIQLAAEELALVATCVRKRRPCRFLVFGVGNDSGLWKLVNRGGRTVFLEDDDEWLGRARASVAGIEAYRVQYGHLRQEWRELLDAPDRLQIKLPGEVAWGSWDVVLVDGPKGYEDVHPGRMESIYAASRLVAPGGRVFVHDCEREVESAYCDRYLGAECLIAEVDKLREYERPG